MELPGEQLLIKLIDALSQGIGATCRPWLIRREGKAKALVDAETVRIARLAQEQLRQEIRDVRAGKKAIGENYKLIAPPESMDKRAATALEQTGNDYVSALADAGASSERLIELERRINLDQISLLAMEEGAEDPSAPDDKPLDADWFAQWRNRAQDVSAEEMQRLWARVLKGEALRGNSYSIHTLDFLSRMSRADAELLARAGRVAIDKRGILKNDDVLHKCGLSVDDLVYLTDLGLLNGFGSLGTLTYGVDVAEIDGDRIAVFRIGMTAIGYLAKSGIARVDIPVYTISRIARELLTLAHCEADEKYLKAMADTKRGECDRIRLGEGRDVPGGFEVRWIRDL